MKLIPTAVTQKLARQVLLAKKSSPKLLFAAGIAGVVTSTVLACRATLKLDKKLDEFETNIGDVKMMKPKMEKGEHLPAAYHKDVIFVYAKGTFELVKLYGPALLIGSASIAALTTSHVTLTRRNAALTSAYSALQMAFDSYRDRVRQEVGAERELELHHAVTHQEMGEGKNKELVPVADPNKWSPYARFFDESNVNWQKDAELNRLFVQCNQNYANHLLHARGHIFLNEVYDMLGLDRTRAGSVVGWVIGNGDNYIDFGIFEAASAQFVNGWERSVILDFNVDGVIYDKI